MDLLLLAEQVECIPDVEEEKQDGNYNQNFDFVDIVELKFGKKTHGSAFLVG
jgi:hypothetical protein